MPLVLPGQVGGVVSSVRLREQPPAETVALAVPVQPLASVTVTT